MAGRLCHDPSGSLLLCNHPLVQTLPLECWLDLETHVYPPEQFTERLVWLASLLSSCSEETSGHIVEKAHIKRDGCFWPTASKGLEPANSSHEGAWERMLCVLPTAVCETGSGSFPSWAVRWLQLWLTPYLQPWERSRVRGIQLNWPTDTVIYKCYLF